MPTNGTAYTLSNPPSPAELRSMLGANLRQLSRQAASISALCRDLGINRTQYNRYLSGESFPRPDVLYKICSYFKVDARILLEPVEEIEELSSGILQHPAVADYLGSSLREIAETEVPTGFYRFARRSFMDDTLFVQGMIYIFRKDGLTFMRGFEAKDAMRMQGLSTSPHNREFRGALLKQEDGFAALVSRKGATTASFNYLAPIPGFDHKFWVGYVTRTVRENVAGRRVERMIYEYLGRDATKVLPAARTVGFCKEEQLPPYYQNTLRANTPFS